MGKRVKKIIFDQPTLPFEEFAPEGTGKQKRAEAMKEYTDLEGDDALGKATEPDMRLRYISFGSGSSGNSCYIGNSRGGFIIDAGLKADEVEKVLKANGVTMQMVKGLLLTHDHSDHVRYAYGFVRNHRHMGLYCTPRVLNGILRRHNISKRIKEYHEPIFKEIPFKIMDFEITAFDVPHDGSDNMGFSIEWHGKRFVMATDLGAVTDRARYYMSRANYLVIEANYDADMLRLGRYPEHLKARIQTDRGHMRNEDTAAFLKEIINPDLKHIFLCHLSQDNNTPEKALRAVREALESAGVKVGSGRETIEDREADVQLSILPRFEASPWYMFR